MPPFLNLAARIFSRNAHVGVSKECCGAPDGAASLHSTWRPQRQLQLKAADRDLLGIGQSIVSAGAQTLEKIGRQFQPLPYGFPPGPQGDVALRLLANPLAFLDEMNRTYGQLVGMLLGGEHVVLVSDPAAAEKILISGNSQFAKEGTAFFPGSRLAGNGLLVSDGAIWQRQRQLSNPGFRKAAVDTYLEAMSRGAEELVNKTWTGRRSCDVYTDFNDLTLRIVTDVLFGFQTSSPDSREVTTAVKLAMEYFASRAASGFAVPEWLPTPDNVQYNEAVSRLDDIVYRIIAQRRYGEVPTTTGGRKCLLDNLLAARDDGGQGMSDRALRDELMTLLIAGQETSAIVLGWTCALLAHHPLAQAEVQEELQQCLGAEPPAPRSIGGLHFLEAAVLESMRLLPPAYMVGRCATQQVTLGSYSAPKGTTLLVSPYLMHRDPRKWERAQEFRPQRWMTHLNASGQPHAYMSLLSSLGPNGSYLPFGAGPRNCIGNYFAMAEVVLVTARILQTFSLKPLPGASFPAADAKITLRPSTVNLVLERRTP